MSLRLIEGADPDKGSVLDVGSGTSTLADELRAAGWRDLTVLDISAEALAIMRARCGEDAGITFQVADATTWTPARTYDVWHDRAVFHFLVDAAQREAYVRTVLAAVRPGGAVVMGTFAHDGPEQCSGLPTARYSHSELAAVFGSTFSVELAEGEEHVTPWGSKQAFVWLVLRRTAESKLEMRDHP